MPHLPSSLNPDFLSDTKGETVSEDVSEVQGSLKQLPEKGLSTCFENWVEQ